MLTCIALFSVILGKFKLCDVVLNNGATNLGFDISWIVPYIPFILSVVNLLVLAYNIKLNRDTLKLRRWVEMLQHSNLLIRLEGITDLQIGLTNVGEVPIDKIQVTTQGSIADSTKPIFQKSYTSKTILSPKETTNIPLFNDLEKYLGFLFRTLSTIKKKRRD